MTVVTVQGKTLQGKTLLSVYDERVLSYQGALLRCCECAGGKDDVIHDLRVAIRRLLAVLDVIRVLYPRWPRCRKLRRRLKEQLSSLGGLRDVQVMLASVRQWQMSCAGQTFALWLFKREKLLLEAALVALQLFEVKPVRRKLAALRRKLEAGSTDIDQSAALWAWVSCLHHELLARNHETGQADVRGIHRVRIAFKHFRYSVEVAEAVSPRLSDAVFRWMRGWQTLLGDVQDAVVMEENIRLFLADRLNVSDFSLLDQVVHQREQCIGRFWQQRAELAGFQLPVE